MKTLLGRFVAAGLLAAAGAMCWWASTLERHLAHADLTFTTIGPAASIAEYDALDTATKYAAALPWLETLTADLREHRASAQYSLATPVTPDDHPAVMLIAANAAFRASLAERDRPTLVHRLDDVMNRYVEAMKKAPGLTDAAYNYEYVARLRSILSKARDTSALAPDPQGEMFGRQGAPQAEANTRPFKMVVPMRPDERTDAPQGAGQGARKVRKG